MESAIRERVGADTTLGALRELAPGICDQLQTLGVPEPILFRPYVSSSVSDYARAIGVQLPVLLASLQAGVANTAGQLGSDW